MENLIFIIGFLVIGILLRLSGRLPDNATKVLGGFVITVSLPATALQAVHNISIEPAWVLAAASPWIGAVIAVVFFVLLGRRLGWSHPRVGGLILVAGWGNTSFVGLPMIAAFAGTSWLSLGLFIDLFGSYLALSTLGILIASLASHEALSAASIVRRVVTFPPFIAIIVALATNSLDRPPWLEHGIDALAATMTPLALAAVGFALRIERLGDRLAPLIAALGFRLLIAPITLLVLYLSLGSNAGDIAVRNIAILEMAMPPMLGATIIAIEYDLEPELVALVIGIGIPISVLSAPLWWQLLQLI